MKSERFEFAVEQFERAEDAGVILPEFGGNRGVCLVFLGGIDRAIQAFEGVLKLDPENEFAKSNLAKLNQAPGPIPSTRRFETFVNQCFIPSENLVDVEEPPLNELAWRRPSVSAQEFAFA